MTISAAINTIGERFWKALPSPGSDDNPGRSNVVRWGPPGSDWVDWPSKNVDDRKRARPMATRLITTPDTM